MQINNSFVSENTIISMTSTSKKASPVRTENAFSQSIQSPLDYYNTLCKDYPDVTFRLDDIRTGQEKGWGLGYNNSLNQRGTDFGMAGRCSINIDIAVIERMQKDPKYEQQIKGIIASSRKNYSSYEQSAASDGMPYICVNIEDENGKPLKSITQSPMPFSTEEEINRLMTNKEQQKKVQLKFDSMKNDLLDTYLTFVEDTAGSRIRFKQPEIKKDDPANPTSFSSLTE